MSRCDRPCRYRGIGYGDMLANGCDYLWLTGHSRLKAAMETLGVGKMTPEVHRLMDPAICPFFEERGTGKRPRRRAAWEEQHV